MITRAQIAGVISDFAPLSLQESWDNSGVQVGDLAAECSGVLVAVDPTPEVIAEAVSLGCNMVVSHHPLIFRGLKSLTGATEVERAVLEAIRSDVAVYSAHTSLDSTRGGISWAMARMLGAEVRCVLAPSVPGADTGLGVVAEFPEAIGPDELYREVSQTFDSEHPRASLWCEGGVRRIAMCGGSGGEFIGRAIAAGADAYITADIRYHDYVDHGREILLLDIGHFESERCAKDIFYGVITEKFPNFAVYYSQQQNPIQYL